MTVPPRGPRPASRLGLLRDHDFRGLFLSTTVSQFGHQITILALPLVAVLALEADELEVGVLAAMTMIAFLLIGLPAGAWVDRMRRRNVLINADVLRAAVLLTVPLAWWADMLTIWHLYLASFTMGVFTVFFDVAYQSYLPHLVGRAKLVEGNAKLETVRSTALIGGPALAGQLIAWLTAPVALALDAIAMGASALFVVRIRKREPKPQLASDAKLAREIREGLSFVLRNRLLASTVTCAAWANIGMGAYMAMIMVFLPRDLGLSAGEIGLLTSVVGIGGLIGAVLAKPLAAWWGEGRAIWMSMAVFAPGMLLIPGAEEGWRVWLGALGMGYFSIGIVVFNVTQVSFRQRLTPDRLLGRMNATVRCIVWGTQPLGAIAGGLIGQFYGARTALWLAAGVTCLAFLPVLLSPLRNMRELPSPPEEAEPVKVAAQPNSANAGE